MPARWRDLRYVVPAFAASSFSVLAGSFGVFLIFAAPDPGRCRGEGLTQTALSSGAPGSSVDLPPRKVWWKKGNRDSVVCGCMWCPLAVGAC